METVMQSYVEIESPGVPIKAWTRGVAVEPAALQQLQNVARLPFVCRWVAAMPDVHWGIGATVGSVIPTQRAIIPAAVGVDIGCGMMAVRTTLRAQDLPDSLRGLRDAIERAVPHGRTDHGGRADRGAWHDIPAAVGEAWKRLGPGYTGIIARHPKLDRGNHVNHLGTLGTGNHFIEVCLDEADRVWLMLHSGSRGVGNRIGSYFIELAKKDMRRWFLNLPNQDLAYFPEGSEHFGEYWRAVAWAQDFAATNREIMMRMFPELFRATRMNLSPVFGLYPDEDGSVQVVFNGEIYNFQELRRRLERRHRFRTRGTNATPVMFSETTFPSSFVDSLSASPLLRLWDPLVCCAFAAR